MIRHRCRQFERVEGDSNSCFAGRQVRRYGWNRNSSAQAGVFPPGTKPTLAPSCGPCLRLPQSAQVSSKCRQARRPAARIELSYRRPYRCPSRRIHSSGEWNRLSGCDFLANLNQGPGKIGEDGLRELRSERYAQASRSTRNRRRANRTNAEAAGLQARRKSERHVIRSQHDGHEMRIAPRDIKAVSLQFVSEKTAEICDVRTLCFPQLRPDAFRRRLARKSTAAEPY